MSEPPPPTPTPNPNPDPAPASAPAPAASSASASATDQILLTVAREQAYQDLNDRLQSLEEELRREREEGGKVRGERDELASTNAQLREITSSAQTTFLSTSASVRDYETRLKLLEQEKEELQQDYAQAKAKGRMNDDLIRKYRENAESDGRQIRQLDVERSEAVYARNKIEHQQKILAAAVDSAQKEVQVYSQALMDREADFSAYRSSHYLELQQSLSDRDRESQARITAENARSSLQRQYDSNLLTLSTLQSELTTLHSQLSKKTSDFRSDSAALQSRIDQLEARSKEDREAVEGLEDAFREAQEEHARKVAELDEEVEEAREKQEEAEKKMEEMARMVELLGGTGSGSGAGSGFAGDEFSFSPAADLAASTGLGRSTASTMSASVGGKTVRQALSETIQLRAELNKVKAENQRLEDLCKNVLKDIEERKPVLDQQRAEYMRMKSDVDDLARRLASTSQAKDEIESQLTSLTASSTSISANNDTLKSQVADLSLQVLVLLREQAIKENPKLAYEPFDPVGKNSNDLSDIDAVITNNLTAFKKLPDLIEQNKKLLRISRELGRKLEDKVASAATAASNVQETDLESATKAIENLSETVQTLRTQLTDVRSQLDLAIKERDMFSRLLVQGRIMGMSNGSISTEARAGSSAHAQGADSDAVVQSVLSSVQAEFDKHREGFKADLKEAQNKLELGGKETAEERERTASALAALRHEQNENLILKQKVAQDRVDVAAHLNTIANREAEILNLRTEVKRLTDQENLLHQQKNQLQSLADGIKAQKEILQANDQANAETTNKLFQEKAEIARELASRKLLQEQELLLAQNAKSQVESTLEGVRKDLETAREALTREQAAHQALLSSNKSAELQKQIQELQTSITERDQKITKLESDVTAAQTDASKKLRIGLGYQNKFRDLESQMNTLKEEQSKTTAEQKTQLDSAKSEAQTSAKQLADNQQQLESKIAQLEAANREIGTLKQTISEKESQIAQAASAAAPAASSSALAPDAQLQATVDELRRTSEQQKSRVVELESQLAEAQKARDQAVTEQNRLATANAQIPTPAAAPAEESKPVANVEAQLEKVKSELSASLQSATQRAEQADAEVTKLRARVSELEAAASAPAPAPSPAPAPTPPAATATEGGGDQARYDALSTEFAEYKTQQEARYSQNVSKVNTANQRFSHDLAQWRAVRNHLEALQKQYGSPPIGPKIADIIPGIDGVLEAVRADQQQADAAAKEADLAKARAEAAAEIAKANAAAEAAKAEVAKAEAMKSEAAQVAVKTEDGAEDTIANASGSDARLKDLQAKLDKALEELQTATTTAKVANEKAAKLAVKANMMDKFKKEATDLRARLSATGSSSAVTPTTAAAAAAPSALSIKGEASAPAAAAQAVSADDGIDITATSTSPAGQTAQRGRGGAQRGGAQARGNARGGSARGGAGGRGGRLQGNTPSGHASLPANPHGPAAILAAASLELRGSQKRRASDNPTDPSATSDGAKRAKLDQQPGSGPSDQGQGGDGGATS